MGNNPVVQATIRGVAMQALMVVVGYVVPAFGQQPNGRRRWQHR